MKLKPILIGLATFVPGVGRRFPKGTGGTDSARYCYSVWLRHLVMAGRHGLNTAPGIVAELGPGDSLGIGLAALLSGCDRYVALDVVEHANTARNVDVFDELVTLFRDRAPIPGADEFPEIKPTLENYEFPAALMDERRLREALGEARIRRIRDSVRDSQREESLVQYRVPWHDPAVVRAGSVEMIYSQAVLEHVDDLKATYRAMRSWLRPDGYLSHQIDFRSHGITAEWNGHWACSRPVWRLIRGNRRYLLNREPHSTHITTLREQGFEIVCDTVVRSESRLSRKDLALPFRSLSDEDLVTSGAFIQAVKKAERVAQDTPSTS